MNYQAQFQQRLLLAVQIGQFDFKFHMIVRGARDIARAARTRTDLVDGFVHGGKHVGVLPHAQIIV